MEIRLITPEEWKRTEELFALAFRIPLSRRQSAKPDDHLHWAAFDEDGEMMSTLTVPTYTMWFDGQPVRMGGIGGVATLPQYRRRGGIRGCFEVLLPELYRRGYDFSYLYPFSTCFYRKFGYESCVQKQVITVELHALRTNYFTGTYRMAEPGRDLRRDFQAVDAIWERSCNMQVLHEQPEDYRWVTELDPAAGDEYAFVWYDESGAPAAYVRYQPKEDTLECSRFHFTTPQSFLALLGLLQGASTVQSKVRFFLPENRAVYYLLREWSWNAISWNQINGGMVRVIRVQPVLEKAKYIGSGQVTVAVTDPQIPENTGTYRVCFRDGRAQTVSKTDAAPDAVLTVPAFSALISGVCSFEEAAKWLPGVEQKRDNPALSQVFYRKEMYIEEEF